MDQSSLTVFVLFSTVALRLAIVLGAVWLFVPRRRTCPHCGETTARLLGPRLAAFLKLERRFCLECGWSGISKRDRRSAVADGRPRIPTASVILIAIAGSSCVSSGDRVRAVFDGGATWVDLSYTFSDETIYWPTAQSFSLERVAAGMTPGGYFYAANNFSAAEHGGTHLDAPIHFAEGRLTTDSIPLDRLIGPAVVVDVSARASADPDYQVTVADLEAFESERGLISAGAILLIRTGWGSRWPDRQSYLGTDLAGPDAVPHLRFPGLAAAAATWLVANRSIDAIGIDTPSIDRGQSTTFDSHRILFDANVPAFENVARLDQMPDTGSFVVALPMKIGGGSGGPLRIVGVIPDP